MDEQILAQGNWTPEAGQNGRSSLNVTRFDRTCLFLAFFTIAPPMSAQIGRPASAPAKQGADQIIARETGFMKLYVTGNLTALEKILAPDYIDVEQEIQNREQYLAARRKYATLGCRPSVSTMVNPKVEFLAPDIATLVYRTVEAVTCSGHTVSGATIISSVWVRSEGRWQMRVHTEYTDMSGAGAK